MSKITTILMTTGLTLGMLGTPNLVVAASPGSAELVENVYNDFFRPTRVDPYAGLVMLALMMPDGWDLERIVAARPAEDRYRLMSELDAAALSILDGGDERLILAEVEGLDERIQKWRFENWVGFWMHDYMTGGVKFMERNPADVIYIGVLLSETMTGTKQKYYYKIDYRDCAHQPVILSGEATTCMVENEDGKIVKIVPDFQEEMTTPPTWEEELFTLGQEEVREYLEALERLEAAQAAGERIEEGQIAALENKQTEISEQLARFPGVTVAAIDEDYQARLAALREALMNQETESSGGGSVNGTTTGVTSEVDGGAEETETAKGASVSEVTEVTEAATVTGTSLEMIKPETMTENVDLPETRDEALSMEGAGETGDLKEVPKLGGEKAEDKRYGLAVLIGGASLIGIGGWFLIGLISKKRKRQEG